MKNTLYAPGKINLTLNILDKNEKGMHNLSSIMHTLDLSDEITVEIFKSDNMKINLKSNLPYIPTDNRNLVYRCIEIFFVLHSIRDRIDVYINKNIPVSAGLGGGSSDATEMLLFLDRYYKTNLSYEDLCRIAIVLGSDCPFFIKKGTCLVEGIGEIVTPIKNVFNNKDLDLKVETPNIKVSTKEIYELYDENLKNIDVESKKRLNKEREKKVIRALEIGDKNLLKENIFNDLEDIAISKNKEISDLKNKLSKENSICMMSGSGPSVFYTK